MLLALALVVVLALLEVWAVYRGFHRLEYFAKPAIMLVLLIALARSAGLSGSPLWFAIGLLFSLAGDLFMVRRERFLIPALACFLLTHLAYLVGFNLPLPPLSLWTLLLAVILGLSGARLMRRVQTGLLASGQSRLAFPVMAYGVVLTLMLLSAMLTLSNPAWTALASLLVALGAGLFFLSDNIIAWDKFVAPIERARLKNIIPYEFGQILLIAGVILQFARL